MMQTDSRFRMGEFEFQLGEACRMFYPSLRSSGDRGKGGIASPRLDLRTQDLPLHWEHP